MTDDQNKPSGGDSGQKPAAEPKLPGPLPGLGGAKPAGVAPLPGIGAKPGAAPLPGLGGAKPGGAPAPLPGLGGVAPKPVVPPFMQQAEPEKPKGPSREQLARDPFSDTNLPPQRPSFVPEGAGLISGAGDAGAAFSEAEAGKSRKPLILGGVLLVLIALLLGYLGGRAIAGRVALNMAIRDALIVQYEIKKTAKLFNEVQNMVSAALQQAAQRKYHKEHLSFLGENVKRNPVKPQIFTERNYKNFDAAAVQWLNDYYNKWGELYDKIEEHRRATKNDEKMLLAAGAEFTKLLSTQYGAVFTRDDKLKALIANLVVMGTMEQDKDGKMMVQVQVGTGTFGDARQLYNPEPGDGELTKEPDKYVVPVGDHSKTGLLKNASQSHFEAYATRIRDISDLMKGMAETQQNLLNKLSEICSQDPVGFLAGGIDPEEEVAEYITNDKSGAGDMPAEAPAE